MFLRNFICIAYIGVIVNASSIFEDSLNWPDGCHDTDCSLSISWAGVAEDVFSVTLSGKSSEIGDYIAFGLPDKPQMGPAPVIACSSAFDSKTKIQWNTDSYASLPINVSDPFLQVQSFKESNGSIECSLRIQSIFIIDNGKQNTTIDLNRNPYAIIMATGKVDKDGSMVQHTLAKKSNKMYIWGDTNPYNNDHDYSDCDETHGCFGYPDNCVNGKNCSILLKWIYDNSKFNMVLKGQSKESSYIAVGFSLDNVMGNDTVVACTTDQSADVYWNVVSNSLKTNASKSVMSNTSVAYVDDDLSCTFTLNSSIHLQIPLTNETASVNLENQQVHLMLAAGPIDSKGIIQYHSDKIVSVEEIDLKSSGPNAIYDSCNNEWECVGMPDKCVESKNCSMIVKWQKETAYVFKMYGKVNISEYIAVGLSLDNMMGDDSVIACLGNGNISMFWNTANPYTSLPVDNLTQISQMKSSYIDDAINCEFELQAKFDVVNPSSGKPTTLNLDKTKYYTLLAVGPFNESNYIEHHTNKMASVISYFGTQDIYEGCDSSFYCLGMPIGCKENKNCSMLVQWQQEEVDKVNVKMFGNVDVTQYLALGISEDNLMGSDSVIACLGNGNISMFWNTASPYNSLPVNDISPISNLKSNFVDNVLSCELTLVKNYTVNNPSLKDSFNINLENEQYYALLAIGPFDDKNLIQHHTMKYASTKPVLGTQDIYVGCKSSYSCLGMPEGCETSKNCTMLSKWKHDDELTLEFHLFGNINDNEYIAFAFSKDNMMGSDSVIACLGDGSVSMFWNTANPWNSLYVNDSSPISSTTFSHSDGQVHCGFKLTTMYDVTVPKTNESVWIDLNSKLYYALLALGPIEEDSVILHHTSKLASTKSIDFSFSESPRLDYSGCNNDWGCQGMPENCLDSQNCTTIVKWMGLQSKLYQFELSGLTNNSDNYIALGLSLDNLMGNDSVLACLANGNYSFFWNTANPYTSLPVPGDHSDILKSANTSFSDGKLTCFYSISSELHGIDPTSKNSNFTFDLNNGEYYMLLASGPFDTNNIIQHHTEKIASEEALDFTVFNRHILPDIYENCYETKGCFGTNSDCIENKNCDIIATYQKISSSHFKYEIGFHSSSGVGYGALAFSDDASMGNDSVMACIINNGQIDVNMYWNTGNPKNSLPLKDLHYGLSNITGSYTNGYVICTFTREAVTYVPNPNVNSSLFDMANTSYYLFLALGNLHTDSNLIAKHSSDYKTGKPIDMASYGPVKNASLLFIKLHGIALSIAWLLFANTGTIIARYYKNHFQGKKLFKKDVWFTVHQSLMYSAIILSVLGMVPIVIEKGVSPIQQKVIHSLLGLAGLALALLQPVIAALRCSPDHPSRPFFTWSHRIIALAVLVLTHMSVLWVTWLPTPVVPDYFMWIITGVVIFVVLMNLMISLYNWVKDGEALKTLEDNKKLNYFGLAYTSGLMGFVLVICILIILGQ